MTFSRITVSSECVTLAKEYTIKPMGENTQASFCILGALLDTYNNGCRALAASLIGSIKDVCPAAKISLVYPNDSSGKRTVKTAHGPVQIDVVHYRHRPTARIQEQVVTLLAAAVIYRLVNHKGLRREILRRFPPLKVFAEASIIGDVRGGGSFSYI
jgi:hypothetical protein